MLIGISGFAGTGKDTVADILVRDRNMVKVAVADPMKRVIRDVYDFSDDQLWGPSELRSVIDPRYPRPAHIWEPSGNLEGEGWRRLQEHKCACCGKKVMAEVGHNSYGLWVLLGGFEEGTCYLTPRYALQTLGTEWGRHAWPETWVHYAYRTYEGLQAGGYYYEPRSGLRPWSTVNDLVQPKTDVVVPDIRYKGEFEGFEKRGCVLIRVRRPGYDKPQWNHPSETEQLEIPDASFHHVLLNDSTPEALTEKVKDLLQKL